MEGQPAAMSALDCAGKSFLALPLSTFAQRRSSLSKDSELQQPTVCCSFPFGHTSSRGIRRHTCRDSARKVQSNSAGQPGSDGNYWLVKPPMIEIYTYFCDP